MHSSTTSMGLPKGFSTARHGCLGCGKVPPGLGRDGARNLGGYRLRASNPALHPPGETMAFKLGDEDGFRWVGAYEISADELLDGKEGKATETKLERGAKLIRELLADKKEISIRELDEKAKEQGISGRTMRDVRSRMKNELEYQVNEKQENSIRLKE